MRRESCETRNYAERRILDIQTRSQDAKAKVQFEENIFVANNDDRATYNSAKSDASDV